MARGYLTFVLHAHLPFIPCTASGNSLEERWLYEAVLECYVPLLMALERLHEDGVPAPVAVSVTPTLLAMLASPAHRQGLLRHLDRLRELARREEARLDGTPFAAAARWHRERLDAVDVHLRERLGGDVVAGFRRLVAQGLVEPVASAATHAFLPLVRSREAVLAQVSLGLAECERHLGRRPAGFWLPECGYAPGLDEVLAEAGVRYFFAATHALETARPRPPAGVHRPVLTPAGVAVFGRDAESSRQVWDRHQGYPGDPEYREFYRDAGWDLPMEYVAPYVLEGGVRADTGLKFYRITGPGPEKEPYVPERAVRRAREHAGHFVASRRAQVRRVAAEAPVVVAPYDAELFGHWWHEGPLWLEEVFRALAAQDDVAPVTPGAYLDAHPPDVVCRLPLSSWGAGGYCQVWLNGANDWLYPRLHRAEERMGELARRHGAAAGVTGRALRQVARELLLAQASDWAFMMTMGSAPDYAARRAREHLEAFEGLAACLESGAISPDLLEPLESRHSVFPALDHRIYAGGRRRARPRNRERRVLMLTWEFPPFVVGGLGRHVAGLAESLALQGDRVAVISVAVPGAPPAERRGRLRVWRVGAPPDRQGDFLGWVYRFNEALAAAAGLLLARERCDVIHAHDWIVGPAAVLLKHRFRLPLVATIHATEHGRNGGLATELHRAIHREEWRLASEAAMVIGCSRYMIEEIGRLFFVPAARLALVPNGVEADRFAPLPVDAAFCLRWAGPGERIVLYVGRLVAEKGVQVLLEAARALLDRLPGTVFLVAGQGEYRGYLERSAADLVARGRVRFLGHVEEAVKRRLLGCADVVVVPSLYEPFGIVALEAMAAGRPVIVSDVGGLAEIVTDGVTGLKVPPGEAGPLASALERLLGDRVLACSLGARAAGEVRRRFAWEAVAATTREVYEAAAFGGAAAGAW